MFSFHSKDWWRHLWEKTRLIQISSCYEMEDLGFNDVEFLNSDTNHVAKERFDR